MVSKTSYHISSPSELETISVATKLSNLLGGHLTPEGLVEITSSGIAISLAVLEMAGVTVSSLEVLLVISLEIA